MSTLTRTEISARADPLGWRLILADLVTAVPVESLDAAARVAATAAAALPDAEDGVHLRADLHADRVVLRLQTPALGRIGRRDLELAAVLSAALDAAGWQTGADVGGSPQSLEISIDALDAAAIRPFWATVLGYADDPDQAESDGGGLENGDPVPALVDPLRRGPLVWFQQMDAPRPQRNRIHLDVTVPPEAAPARVAAALDAGGTLLSDDAAPAWWVLADAEGNEVCVCTWQGRD